MKFYLTTILSFLTCFNIWCQIPEDSLVKPYAIVDGLFFDKTVPAKSLMPSGSTLANLKDPDGATVYAVYPPKGFELEDSIRTKSIPAENVKYSEKLLRDYNGRRPHKPGKYNGLGTKAGIPFIDFEYTDIDGKVWNNEILKGKVYVINIWQSECGPCRREMPELSKWKEKFPDVVFLSASRHNKEEILPIAERHEFTWIHLQEATDLVALVGQQGFPLTIIVDADGIVRYAKVGATEENQAEAVAILKDLSYK